MSVNICATKPLPVDNRAQQRVMDMTKRSVLRFRQLHRHVLKHNIDEHTRSLRLRTFVYDDLDLGCERLQHF